MNFGYIPSEYAGQYHGATLCDVSEASTEGEGKVVLLYKYLERVLGGPMRPRDQGKTPSCVGQSIACGIDILTGVQIKGLGLPQEWIAAADAITCYAGSRYEIGYKRYGSGIIHKAGSRVPWSAEFVRDFGCLFMKQYPQLDLSEFTKSRSDTWGRNGVPDELEGVAREHPIKDFLPVKSYEELRGAINNGYPVAIGSSYGFKDQKNRNEDGFLKPRGTWRHAMCVIAVDDEYKRPGGLIMNSWGDDWVDGPKRHDQPDGSFWVDAEVLDDMMKDGEGVALSQLVGFPSQKSIIDYNLF